MQQVIIYFTNKKKQLVEFLEVYEKMVHNIKIRAQLEVDRQFDSIQQLINERKIDQQVLRQHLLQNQSHKRVLMEDITKQINQEISSWINNKTINQKYQSNNNWNFQQLSNQRKTLPVRQNPSSFQDFKLNNFQSNPILGSIKKPNSLRASSLSKFSIVQQKNNNSNKKITITKNHEVCQSLDHKIRNEAVQILKRTQSANKRGRSPMRIIYDQPSSKKKQYMDSISQFTPISNSKPFMYNTNS